MESRAALVARARVSIPQAVWIACNILTQQSSSFVIGVSIPQAVWIACNNNLVDFGTVYFVSIPQAVWIACNDVFFDQMKGAS